MSSCKIVVIDDVKELTELLKVELENCNYEVHIANEGQSGLDLIRSVKPDLVVLDIIMSPMNGYEVLERLKEDQSLKDIPVIVLTVKNLPDTIQKAIDAGADEYIVKPFNMDLLLKRIRLIINK